MHLPRLRLLLVLLLALAVSAPARSEPPAEKKQPTEAKKPVRTDLYGDPLPEGAIARLGTVRLRHKPYEVMVQCFSPDGKMLATADYYALILWDTSTGKALHHFKKREWGRGGGWIPSYGMVWAPDGKLIASIDDHVIRFFDPATGEVVRHFPGHEKGTRWGAFSPDGRILAIAGQDRTGPENERVELREPSTGKKLRVLEGKGPIAFSPDGRVLVSAAMDGKTIQLWEVATGKKLREFREHFEQIWRIAFSPNGQTLASADQTTIRIWNVATAKEVRQWQGHREGVHYLNFALVGEALVSSGRRDDEIVVWDTMTGKVRRRLPTTATGECTLSPDGRTLATCYDSGSTYRPRLGVIELWDLATGKQIVKTPELEGAIAFSADGKNLVSAGRSIRRWDVATGRVLFELPSIGKRDDHALVQDGKLMASWDNYEIRLRDTKTGKQVRHWQVESGIPSHCRLVFSPDGKRLASPTNDGSVHLWDVATGKEIRRLRIGKEQDLSHSDLPRTAIAFSPDSAILAFAFHSHHSGFNSYEKRGVHLWEVETGKLLHRYPRKRPEHFSSTEGIAFSQDGKILALGLQEAGTLLLEVASGERIGQFKGERRDIEAIAISPDGRTLAEGGYVPNSVWLWDMASGEEIRNLRGHEQGIYSLAFSPDGQHLISASSDTTALVWHMPAILRRRATPPAKLDAKDLVGLWEDLSGSNAAAAYRAIWALAAVPKHSIPLVQERLRELATSFDYERVVQLIQELDDKTFAIRDKAREELTKIGSRAAPALRAVLKKKPSLEVRRRIEELLSQVDAAPVPPERVRAMRATAVLEYIGSAEAQKALEALARGPSATPETEEAIASLNRLAKRAGTAR